MSLSALQKEYKFLSQDSNFPSDAAKAERGRRFETLLFELLKLEGLFPRKNFRPKGEELDGSFIHHNRVFLLEAKWKSGKIPASTIYQFKSKVDGKLVGTIGVFLSISEYSSEAIDALSYGKSLNIILFDKKDIERCIFEENGFKKILDVKIRIATEEGIVYHSTSPLSLSPKSTSSKRTTMSFSKDYGSVRPRVLEETEKIIFIVEGYTDQLIVGELGKRIMEREEVRKHIEIFVSGGKFTMSKLVNSRFDSFGGAKIVVIADADSDASETNKILRDNLEVLGVDIIVPEPTIESWLLNNPTYKEPDEHVSTLMLRRGDNSQVKALIQKLDISSKRKRDTAFDNFYKTFTS